MAGAATDLYDLCAEFLRACEDAVAVAPGGPIDRTFVSPGPPAWDCPDQLTVHAGGPLIGDTMPTSPPLQVGHRVQETGTLNIVTLTATILRCVPIPDTRGNIPDAADIDAAARLTLGDVWSVWSLLKTRKRNGSLWPSSSRELFLDPAVPVNTSGGAGGWQIQIRVGLEGYETP